MLMALRRDGMAGVCGVWGEEIGFPGEDEVETEVPWTIGGTPDNRLDDVEDRCSRREEDRESERAELESLMRWNRVRAAEVRRVAASMAADRVGLKRSFLKSSIFKKSEIFSSSACMESALVPVASARMPEPGCAVDDVALPLPLELLSSSTRGVPPEESRPRRWLKELLYFEIGAGLGDAEFDDPIACSGGATVDFRGNGVGPPGGVDCRFVASAEGPVVGGRTMPMRGAAPRGDSPSAGEADSGGALNGWKDPEGRRAMLAWLSPTSAAVRPVGMMILVGGGGGGGDDDGGGGDGELVPNARAARRVEIGLAPVTGPT